MNRRMFLKLCSTMPLAAAVTVSAATMIQVAESMPLIELPPAPEIAVDGSGWTACPTWMQLLRHDDVIASFGLNEFSIVERAPAEIDIYDLASYQREYVIGLRDGSQFDCMSQDPSALKLGFEIVDATGIAIGMSMSSARARITDPSLIWMRCHAASVNGTTMGEDPFFSGLPAMRLRGTMFPHVVWQGPGA